MAVADRYGWHRDELYYLASSRHPALGYVDYPPITPLLARLDQAIFPGSLPALRLLTVLAGAAIIVIAALIARELGGNELAQTLAARAPACRSRCCLPVRRSSPSSSWACGGSGAMRR